MLNAQFFTDTGQHREKTRTLAVYLQSNTATNASIMRWHGWTSSWRNS